MAHAPSRCRANSRLAGAHVHCVALTSASARPSACRIAARFIPPSGPLVKPLATAAEPSLGTEARPSPEIASR